MNAYTTWAADPRWTKNVTASRAASIGGNVTARNILLPIPSIELGVNKQLKQNSLWAN